MKSKDLLLDDNDDNNIGDKEVFNESDDVVSDMSMKYAVKYSRALIIS